MAPAKSKGGKGKKVEKNTPPPRPSTLVEFPFHELSKYGNKFPEDTELGDGCGTTSKVYKVTIPANRIKGLYGEQRVAVKVITKAKRFEKQFDMEKEVLGEITHSNIIKLIGYSNNVNDTCALVYEYMPNGSLTDKISGYNWDQSIMTMKGIVSAINCLHSKNPPIIHRDVKPDNILLDKDFTPKLGDFGLAVRGDRGWPRGGTDGYSDSSVFKEPAKKEFDIFSIGILIMELLVKRKMREDDINIMDLPDWVRSNTNHPRRVAAHLLSMGGGCTEKKVSKAVNLALRCTEEDTTRRPKINEVMEYIEDLMS